jgi:CBS domain-containing protein
LAGDQKNGRAIMKVFSGNLYACNTQDNIRDAPKLMRAEKVGHLPAMNANGTLEGIVSLNDIVLHAGDLSKDGTRHSG